MPSLPQERRRTEHRNPASRGLDRLSTLEILKLMNREDRKVAHAVGREISPIARAVDAIVTSIRKGGRLIYVGGTSGRLAILDAAECPPTFGISPNVVQAVIAGGRPAVTGAVEGAEDSVQAAVRDLRAKNVSRDDVVVGIAASGSTPYVLRALAFAKKRGAVTVAVTSSRNAPIARHAQFVIAPDVGPEVITGSTRLKAGTSQKLVLNMLSTAAMVRLGHVYENLMIDVAMTNHKLRQRGLRILVEASGARVSQAERALRQSSHDLRLALTMLMTGTDAKGAQARLALTKGNLRQALGER
jgi:N-acetylmuramic acid 6-phosphate etherase